MLSNKSTTQAQHTRDQSLRPTGLILFNQERLEEEFVDVSVAIFFRDWGQLEKIGKDKDRRRS